MKYIEFFS